MKRLYSTELTSEKEDEEDAARVSQISEIGILRGQGEATKKWNIIHALLTMLVMNVMHLLCSA